MNGINQQKFSARMLTTRKWSFIVALALTLTPMAHAAWSEGEDPNLFMFQDEKLETTFTKLRLNASVDEGGGHKPWSETYWPAKEGGIAVRYIDVKPDEKSGNSKAFKAKHPDLEQLKMMSPAEIKLLSASEKFDILKGNYDYPLTKEVLAQYKPSNPSWWGICHGWTPAAVNYPEPLPITVKNDDGIEVQFASSDVKALISYYYAWKAAQYNEQKNSKDGNESQNWGFKKDLASGTSTYWQKDPNMVYFIYRQLGQRCNNGFLTKGACKETNMNPASFHLAISNVVGNYHRSFVVNVDPSKQVWNQPVMGYTSKIIAQKSVKEGEPSHEPIDPNDPNAAALAAHHISKGVVKKILVSTVLTYVQEVDPQYSAHGETNTVGHKTLVYWLELDANDHIVDGEWSRGLLRRASRRTDFIGFAWRASRVPFLGDFAILNRLYKTRATHVTSYAMGLNYTPGLQDAFFLPNAANSSSSESSDLNSFLFH